MSVYILLSESAGLFLATLLVSYIYSYLVTPLKHIPGPFWAKFSDIWRLVDHWRATQIIHQRHLHEELGPAVRIGPKCVSISDPALLKTIYSTRGDFIKSDFYSVNDAVQNGHVIQNVFGTRSNAFHAKYMRPIQKHYTMTSILRMEQLINQPIVSLCEQLENRFIDEPPETKTCDIGDWVLYYAWDVVGEITFSQPMGFLKSGYDVGNMIDTAERVMHYFGIVGQMPILDKLLGKNPYCPVKFPTFANAAQFCAQRLTERISNADRMKGQSDFLGSFLEAKITYPDIVGDNEVVGYLLLNILAGADTAALTQKAIVYYVLKNPSILAKLQAELDKANLPFPAPYESAQRLPYLHAVIKEGLRIHPSVGTILERIVPPTGLTLPDGRVIPPGTIVGMNPWVLSRNKEIYGDDVDTFRPERWLREESEAQLQYEARLKRMEDADLSFGAGNRVCTGRHLAMVELFKVTATLVNRYSLDFENPSKEWKVNDWWFVFTHGIRVKLRRRTSDIRI